MEIKNRVVFITGAGKGLGRAFAIAFAKLGVKVAINDLTDIPLEKIANEIEAFGGQVLCLAGDASKKIQLQTLISQMLDKWGRVDVLINHARVRPQKSILVMDEWEWHRALDVNITSTFLASQTIGRAMKLQGEGIIINVADSVGKQESMTFDAAYQTTQTGIEGFTRELARELSEFGVKTMVVAADEKDYSTTIENVISFCQFS